MKKLLMAVFALCAVLGLAACGDKEADYKLGMGVEVSTTSSTNATAEKAGNAQVDATVAAVVVDKDGKIVACRLDAVQNKVAVSATGEVTVPETFQTKMEKGDAYGMAGSPYSPDNNGDGVVKEWYEQAKAFETYVVGMTAAEVKAMETTTLKNGYVISADKALLNAGCTIQITDFKAAVAAACEDEQGVSFKSKGEFTLGVAADSYSDKATANATAEKAGAVCVYSDFAASVVEGGKIVASLNDAIQPKFAVSVAGELTATYTNTKRGLKEAYGMAGSPYSPDNDGDGRVLEWYEQSLAFSKHVVGMTAAEVAAMTTQTVNDHEISTDENLLAAGCTIQITGIKAVVAKSANNAR